LAAAIPLGSAFTYQGRLSDAGTAANGSYDFQFMLRDALSGGEQIGPLVTTNGVPVSEDLFTVTLDFGSVFDGNARWLDIAVKTNGAASFTPLAPRQPLAPAPYALYAPSAGNAALLNGQSPTAYAPATGSSAYVAKTGDTMAGPLAAPGLEVAAPEPVLILQDSDSIAGQVGYLGFRNSAGTETGWIGFGTYQNAHATFMNNRSGGNTVLGAGGVQQLTVTPNGNVGIGTPSPAARLEVAGMTVLGGPTLVRVSDLNSGIVAVHSTNTQWIGLFPNLTDGAYGPMSRSGDAGLFFVGGAPGLGSLVIAPWNGPGGIRLDTNGNVGIGTPSPAATLDVNGSVQASGPIKAAGGFILETRTNDPPSPVTGQMWLRTNP